MTSPPGGKSEECSREQSTGRTREYQLSDEGNTRSFYSSLRCTSSSGQSFAQSDTDAEASKRPRVSSSENDDSRTTRSTQAFEVRSDQSSVPGSSLRYLAQQRPSSVMDDSTRLALLQQHAERTSESESSSLAPQASLPLQFPAPAAPNVMGRSQYPGNILPSSFLTSLYNPSEFGAAEAMASTNALHLGILQQMMSAQQALAQHGGPNAMMPPQQQYVNPLLAAVNPLGGQLLYQQFLNNMGALGDPRMQVGAGSIPAFASNATQSFSSISEAPGTSSALARSTPSNSATTSAYGNGGQAPQQQERRPGGPVLYMPSDDDILSDHQVLVRKQIEFFEAQVDDVNVVMPGRRKEIVLGQVGIRCRHCAGVPVHKRTKGSVYYPAKLKGLYQAAQNMAGSHLCESCENIDPYLKAELRAYHDGKSSSGHGGKQYWGDSATVLGVIETEEGLRFDPTKQRGKGGRKRDRV